MSDETGCDPVPIWATHIIAGTATEIEYAKALSVDANAWVGFSGYTVRSAISLAEEHNNQSYIQKINEKPNMNPRKDKKKGSEDRQKTGARERNCKPKFGEEHSRVAKGTGGVKKFVAAGVLVVASAAMIVIIADDSTGVGIANDVLIGPVAKIWWDAAAAF